MANLHRIASKVALMQPLSERRDYGSQDKTAILLNRPEASINDLGLVRSVKAEIEDYQPVDKNTWYPTIDGDFEFILPGGQKCRFVGKLDEHDQNGTLTCDGQDVTEKMFEHAQTLGGDSIPLDFIDPALDPGHFTLDEVLEKIIKDLNP